MTITIIVTTYKNRCTRGDNEHHWSCREDVEFLIKTIKNNIVIMGKQTYLSICYHLPECVNIVVSETLEIPDVFTRNSLGKAISFARTFNTPIFIIGEQKILTQALEHQDCNKLLWNEMNTDDNLCDDYFPELKKEDWLLENTISNENITYNTLVRNQEKRYLELVKDILENGMEKGDRTGVGTLSVFGHKMEYDISEYFPLITTKKTGFKTIIKELLWFLSGDTDAKTLQKQNVKIWDGNTSRGYLDKMGFTERREGDIGAGYGFQWRHSGAEYIDCDTDYSGKGVDQIKDVIEKIKNNPHDRRMIVCAWNPKDLSKMSLPPCHLLFQFYVEGEYLSCQLYQRSGDIMLGIPYNIASYSALVYMIAHVCGKKPKKFIHIIGDSHIYKNHIVGAEEQIKRNPKVFPTLKFTREITDINDFQLSDFELENYNCHPSIKFDLAI